MNRYQEIEENNSKNARYYEALSDLNHTDPPRIHGETYYIMEKYEESLIDPNRLLELEPNDTFALRIR